MQALRRCLVPATRPALSFGAAAWPTTAASLHAWGRPYSHTSGAHAPQAPQRQTRLGDRHASESHPRHRSRTGQPGHRHGHGRHQGSRPSPPPHEGTAPPGHPSPSTSPTSTPTASAPAVPPYDGVPLPHLQWLLQQRAYGTAEAYADAHFDPEKQTLLQFVGNACDARDVVLLLMRSYVALGRMEKVRRIFLVALRDLAASPTSGEDAQLHDGMNGVGFTTAAVGLPAHSQDRQQRRRPSFLNASVFNGYLEALTRRKNYDKDEIIFILDAMKAHEVEPTALTYHYLIELHIRAGYDPQPLWNEAFREKKLTPLPATVQTVLLRVVPHSQDGSFVLEVVREALALGASVMDKRSLTELIEQGLRDRASPTPAASSSSSPAQPPTPITGVKYPPEVLMWLMLELEVRCLLDKASFVQYIQKQHVAELLLRCAKSADATTAAEVLALMERHVMAKTADILSLVVWCWAQAGETHKALDLVELMARKGYLELTDATRPYHVESLRYTMEKNFLMALADALASTQANWSAALSHLRQRKAHGEVVSIHTLDVLVLAAAKLGLERAALRLVLSYSSEWGVQPRTATLNALLLGCTTGTDASSFLLLGNMYEAMLRAGVAPNAMTFRILIRQCVLGDSIDDAVAYLEEVSRHQGLRVEVEMILPILERAARVGDVETANRVSKFSLDCDIGIDGAVLGNVMRYLAEAGQSVEVLKGHQPLHEALRSRSKVGRQRARSELLL